MGATPRVSGYESKLLTVWLRLQNYHLLSNDYSFTSFSTLIFFFFCLEHLYLFLEYVAFVVVVNVSDHEVLN